MIYKNCFFYKQKNVNLMGQPTHKSILNTLLITIKKNTLSKLSVRFVTITEKEFVLLPKVNQEPKSRYCFHLLRNKKQLLWITRMHFQRNSSIINVISVIYDT